MADATRDLVFQDLSTRADVNALKADIAAVKAEVVAVEQRVMPRSTPWVCGSPRGWAD